MSLYNLLASTSWCDKCAHGPHGSGQCPGGTPFCAVWAPLGRQQPTKIDDDHKPGA